MIRDREAPCRQPGCQVSVCKTHLGLAHLSWAEKGMLTVLAVASAEQPIDLREFFALSDDPQDTCRVLIRLAERGVIELTDPLETAFMHMVAEGKLSIDVLTARVWP